MLGEALSRGELVLVQQGRPIEFFRPPQASTLFPEKMRKLHKVKLHVSFAHEIFYIILQWFFNINGHEKK
jgi:hypothetical protein